MIRKTLKKKQAEKRDKLWDRSEDFIKIFPDLKNKFEESLKSLARCNTCHKSKLKTDMIAAMVKEHLEKKINLPEDLKDIIEPVFSETLNTYNAAANPNKRRHVPIKKPLSKDQIPGIDNASETKTVKKKLTVPITELKELFKEIPKKSKAPREPCVNCVKKHIAQAIVLLSESIQGYPEHRWLAIGHLAEASEECLGIYPVIADDIRSKRLAFMEDKDPDLMIYLRDSFEIINNELTKDTQ